MGPSSDNVGGIVLCGGGSQRMGRSKAWLALGEEYLLQRVVRIVAGVANPVVVAARRDQDLPPLPPNVEVVYDSVEDGGPLVGVAAGFEALSGRCEIALVTSCDHPLVKPQFVRRLIDLLGDDSGVIPVCNGQSYPLMAVYRLETRTVAGEMLAQGDRCVRHFADRCGARLVPATDLVDTDPNLHSLLNVNDGDTYAEALRLLEA